MRRIGFVLFFLCLLNLSYALNVPEPVGWVNDFAGVIGPEYKEKLTAVIEELAQNTTSEIAVVTIDSISPYDEKEYARQLFDNWKPGKKGKDNGVLVLIAIKERRWRIETGYGIEGILPDGLCGEIGRNYMVPYFKEGNYAEGLYQGVLKISQIITKGDTADLKTLEGVSEKLAWDAIAPIIFVLFFVSLILPAYRFNKRRTGYGNNTGINYHNSWGSGWGGGGFDGGGGFGGFGGGGGGGGGAGGGF